MNQIKNVLFITIVLLFSACGIFEKTSQTYLGTLSWVKQQKNPDATMGFWESGSVKYKMEILTTEGELLHGAYEDKAGKYKPGDFVKVTIEGDTIEKLEILDRSIMDGHF